MSKGTHEFLLKLWRKGQAAEAGICLIPIISAITKSGELTHYGKDIVFGHMELSDDMLKVLAEEHKRDYL